VRGKLIAEADRRLVPCDELGSSRDVDTPAELEALAEVLAPARRRPPQPGGFSD
jgi:hypothetical protein